MYVHIGVCMGCIGMQGYYIIIYIKFVWLYKAGKAATCGRCRLMSKYKDWENEKLGPRRARFLAVRKQDKKTEASFGTHGGRGCNCRVRRIVVGCYKNKWWGSIFSSNMVPLVLQRTKILGLGRSLSSIRGQKSVFYGVIEVIGNFT